MGRPITWPEIDRACSEHKNSTDPGLPALIPAIRAIKRINVGEIVRERAV